MDNKKSESSNSLLSIIEHLTIVSLTGIAFCAIGYFLFFQWLSYQEYLELRGVMPAMLSVIGFMYAIYRAVPLLEDFWGLKRSRINTDHPFCVYAAIAMWLIFINSIIIAFGYSMEGSVSFSSMLENFFGRYGNDTPHYIAIAERWYQDTLDYHRRNIVFFPFYPILIRIAFFVSPSYLFAAYAVSNIFALAGGIMFYKLAVAVTDVKEARLAVKFLLIFPSAFFLFVPMTESLFLFLSVGVVYYSIKEKYLWVFILGLMAALTRSVGILLIIPAACELIGQLRQRHQGSQETFTGILQRLIAENSDSININVQLRLPLRAMWVHIANTLRNLTRIDKLNLASLLAFPLGIGIYLFINYAVYGSATQFLVFQEIHWGQELYFFWHTITYLTSDMFTAYRNWAIGVSLPGVIAFWLCLALIIYGARKLRPSLTLYALAYFIFAFGPTWLMSGPRYVMVLFPLAFVAAKIAGTKKGYNLFLTIAYLAMFVLYFHEFVRDNFVF